MSGAVISALLRPEVILAISSATEIFVRDLLRQVYSMNEQELDAFIAEQKRRKMDHDEWLREHQP